MIPSIPAVNKLSFDSSGKDGDDFNCLLDKFPMLDGGWAASTICLRKAFLNKPIIKARREDDNVEVNVYPYKIKPGLGLNMKLNQVYVKVIYETKPYSGLGLLRYVLHRTILILYYRKL